MELFVCKSGYGQFSIAIEFAKLPTLKELLPSKVAGDARISKRTAEKSTAAKLNFLLKIAKPQLGIYLKGRPTLWPLLPSLDLNSV